MIAFTFAVIAICWGSLSLYFLWRLVLRRMMQSLIIAFACAAPVVLVARELKWMPRPPTSVFLAAVLVLGVLGVFIILRAEAAQPKPFR